MENKEEHGWDDNGGVYHCSDGAHPSWWNSISRTPQWEAWYKYASKNMLYDVDECLECGWMSEQHAKDFMEFIDKQGYMRAKAEDEEFILPKVRKFIDKVEGGRARSKETYQDMKEVQDFFSQAHDAISKLKEKV